MLDRIVTSSIASIGTSEIMTRRQRVGQGVVDVVERELEVVRPRGEDFDVHGRGERGRGREGNRKVASVLLFLRC